MNIKTIHTEMKNLGDADKAAHAQGFFKTGPGQYGAGDRFLGIRVPVVRKMAHRCRDLRLEQVARLLHSPWHEERLLALLVLVKQFAAGDQLQQRAIYDLYLKNTAFVNNWDLVDSSAHLIVGPWLAKRSRRPLRKLARSKSLWERRISIMATFHYIRQGEFSDTLDLAEMLLTDEHDLIHKAVGWMLREVGNRNQPVAEKFLYTRYQTMPRTMLRYAIEKYPPDLRQDYLKGRV